uniref:Uncharacterized protein n=1 Tax=Zea mays TaxID=4577 RepID=C0P2Z1_MAIZE|nr:unknown [Zea mays]
MLALRPNGRHAHNACLSSRFRRFRGPKFRASGRGPGVYRGALPPAPPLLRLQVASSHSNPSIHRSPSSLFISHPPASARSIVGVGGRHAAGQLGEAGGPAVGARDEPVADDGRGAVGEGAGDRAAAGGDAGDAARPPGVRVRALAHRPRREGRGRSRSRSRSRARDRPHQGRGREGPGRRAVGGSCGEARAEGVGAAAGQRREQLPQQQRRRPAQLLHAALAHPQLHRAATRPDAVVRLRLPEPQRRIRLQQEVNQIIDHGTTAIFVVSSYYAICCSVGKFSKPTK